MAAHPTPKLLTFLQSHDSRRPIALDFRSSRQFLLATVSIAVFTDIFLYGVIVPVIPFALTNRCHVAESDVQHWVSVLLAVYGAALLAAAPVCGWLADRSTSRRLPLLVGLLALAGATLMLCFGRSITVLVVGRILQGASAAVVWTVGLALLVDTVGPHDIGEAMGYVSISMSLGITVAPLLGGVVYERRGYYGVYYMIWVLIIVDILLRLTMVEKKIADRWTNVPEPKSQNPEALEVRDTGQGSSLSIPESIRNAPLLRFQVADKRLTGSLDPEEGLTNNERQVQDLAEKPCMHHGKKQHFQQSRPDTIEEAPVSGSAAADLHSCDLVPEDSGPPGAYKHPSKRPPILMLLSSLRLLSALYCVLAQSVLFTSWDAVLPLRVNKLFGWSSLQAGLIFLPLMLPSLFAPLVGAFSDKYGARLPITIGFVLAMPFLILLRLVDRSGKGQIVLLCALLTSLGATLTIMMTPLLAEITYTLEAKQKIHPGLFGEKGAYAQAYGLFTCAYAGGMLVGPIWAGFVVQKVGWGTMCLTLGLLSLVSAVPAGLFTSGWIGGREKGGGRTKRQSAD
ncbi:MAG: hypothetical protein Q9190_006460 [Brigantiaea leucoxantha]